MGQREADSAGALTELRENADRIHCSLLSGMFRSSPIVGNAIDTAVVFAVCACAWEKHKLRVRGRASGKGGAHSKSSPT